MECFILFRLKVDVFGSMLTHLVSYRLPKRPQKLIRHLQRQLLVRLLQELQLQQPERPR